MEVLKSIFQVDDDMVLLHYKENPNYLIFTDKLSKTNNCVIYFSSNNIYYPNNAETFREDIINKNRYELFGARLDGCKHIFLRDLKKQWYLSGINAEINSPALLLQFLLRETAGFDIVTIGSSAGGYAAVLYGCLLNAGKIMSFNGQVELNSLLKTSNAYIDPLVFLYGNQNDYFPYFDLKELMLKKHENIFYFFSNKSTWDLSQYNHVKDLNVNVVSFKTAHHGIPFLKSNLTRVLNYTTQELIALSNKTYHPFIFSIKVIGFFATLVSLYKNVCIVVKRKWRVKK